MHIPLDASGNHRLVNLSQLMAFSTPVLSPVPTLMLTQDMPSYVLRSDLSLKNAAI